MATHRAENLHVMLDPSCCSRRYASVNLRLTILERSHIRHQKMMCRQDRQSLPDRTARHFTNSTTFTHASCPTVTHVTLVPAREFHAVRRAPFLCSFYRAIRACVLHLSAENERARTVDQLSRRVLRHLLKLSLNLKSNSLRAVCTATLQTAAEAGSVVDCTCGQHFTSSFIYSDSIP